MFPFKKRNHQTKGPANRVADASQFLLTARNHFLELHSKKEDKYFIYTAHYLYLVSWVSFHFSIGF